MLQAIQQISGQPIDLLISRLDGVIGGWRGQYRAICPIHQSETSKSRTLSFRVTGTGSALINCFAGCESEEILKSIGLTFSDLYPPEEYTEYSKYNRKPQGPDLRGIIDRCKTSAMLCEIGAKQILDGQELTKRDLWILRGAAQDLRGLLDAI